MLCIGAAFDDCVSVKMKTPGFVNMGRFLSSIGSLA